MNTISFANFDTLDNPTSFFPQAETDDKTEDFSAILSNIFVTLQKPELPIKPVETETPAVDFKVNLEIAPKPKSFPANDFSAVKNQTDNNLLELPEFETKPLIPTNGEPVQNFPQVETLWAGMPTLRQNQPRFKTETAPEIKLNEQFNQLFQAEPTKINLPEKFTKPAIFNSSDLKNKLPNFPNLFPGRQTVKSNDTVDLPEYFQPLPSPLNPTDANPNTAVMNNQSNVLPPMQTDLPVPQIELPATQNDLSTSETTVNDQFIIKAENTDEFIIKAENTDEFIIKAENTDFAVKPETQVSNVPNVPTVSVEFTPASQISPIKFGGSDSNKSSFEFQSELPEIVLKPTYVNNKLAGFDITPNEVHSILKTFDGFLKNPVTKPQVLETPIPIETVQTAEIPAKNIQSAINFGNTPEYQSPDIWWNSQTKTINPSKFPKVQLPDNLDFRTKIQSNPEFKSEQFETVETETVAPIKVEQFAPIEVEEFAPIKVEQFAPIKVEQFAPIKAEDFAPVKVEEFAPIKVEEFAPVKVEDFAPVKVEDFAPIKGEQFTVNAPIDTKNSNPAESFGQTPVIDFNPNPQIAIKETSLSANYNPLADTDQPQPEVKEDELNPTIKFDKFLESVSKGQKTTETSVKNQTDPAQFAEQINPHLLELAALTTKKNEKQTLKLRLHPAELGTVEIKLERNNAGTLSAFFQTETDGARAALTNNLEQLRDTLQNAGWQIGQMEIQSGSLSSSANQHHENNQRQSDPVENYSFNRNSEKPDELEQNASNRLLSLQA